MRSAVVTAVVTAVATGPGFAGWIVLLGIAASGLSGCASGPAPQDHFYRLDVPAPSASGSGTVLAGGLLVERPTTDALTRGRPLLQRGSESSVEVTPYKYHLWVDSPDLLVQREMIDYLRAAQVASEVSSRQVDMDPRWVLNAHISRMEHMKSGGNRVIVEIEMRVSAVSSRRARVNKTYRAEQAVSGSGIEAAARAFGRAVGNILGQLVRDLEASG